MSSRRCGTLLVNLRLALTQCQYRLRKFFVNPAYRQASFVP